MKSELSIKSLKISQRENGEVVEAIVLVKRNDNEERINEMMQIGEAEDFLTACWKAYTKRDGVGLGGIVFSRTTKEVVRTSNGLDFYLKTEYRFRGRKKKATARGRTLAEAISSLFKEILRLEKG